VRYDIMRKLKGNASRGRWEMAIDAGTGPHREILLATVMYSDIDCAKVVESYTHFHTSLTRIDAFDLDTMPAEI
jgi:hypothetical protein